MTARDFENPTDDHGTDDDNVYGVTVKATDNGTPARTATHDISVTVVNVNDNNPALTVNTPYSVAEGTTAVGTVTTTDGDAGTTTLTYSLTGTDKDDFTITKTGEAQNGVIAFSSAPDFETKTAYSLNVVVSDGTNTTTEAIVVNVTDVNDNSPVLTVNTPYSVAEGQTAVGTVTTTDSDTLSTFTYSLSGTDADDFTITKTGEAQNGVITFDAAPDFETKTAYSLNVLVSDGTNTTTEAIVVNVTNINDNNPVFTSSTSESINEGQTSVSTVEAGDADGNTIAYSIDSTGREDHALFTINSSTGALTMTARDFENPTDDHGTDDDNVYGVTVKATDNGTPARTATHDISVTVVNVNDNSPALTVNTPYSVAEGTTAVGTVTTTDGDAGTTTLTYSLTGTDKDDFTITKTGEAQNGVIAFSSAPDFETKTAYSLNVVVSDGTNTTTEAIVVNVTNVNDNSPVLSVATPYSVAEGQTAVGTVTTTDADAGTTTLTYSLSGTDADDFTITKTGEAQNGVITFDAAPDFETKTAYSLNVLVSDGTNTTTEAIVVNVTNINDNNPVFTSSASESINEGQTSVSTVEAGDADGNTIAYSIDSTGREDHALFTINSSTGALTMTARDFENPTDDHGTDDDNVYGVTVKATDNGTPARTATHDISVTVVNVNDNSPALTVNTPYSVAEGTTAVGTVTTTDADAGTTVFTYSLSGTDADDFTITKTGAAQNGVITFDEAPDFETKTAYSLNVVVSDGTNTTTEAIVVNVTNVNDNNPVFTSSTSESINEGQTSVSTVEAGDADGNTIAYSIDSTGREDHALFTINSSTGALTMTARDFENPTDDHGTDDNNVYGVTVKATDNGTPARTATHDISVTVVNVNEAPALTVNTPYSVAEGTTAVGTVTTTDADAATTFTYSLSGTDADDFTITKTGEAQNGVIAFSSAPDFETKTAYSLNVVVSDGTNTTTEAIVVNVTNVNDNSPVLSVATPYSVAEGQTAVGTVTTTDADAGTTTLTYSLTGTDKDDFTITKTGEAQNGVIAFSSAPDFETKTAYSLNVVVSDGTNTTTEAIVVNVTNVNDNSPALTVNTPYSVAEGTTAVGTVTTTDGDAGTTTFTYSLSGTDADDFTITKTGEAQNGVIAFSSAPDFETKTAYSLNVLVSDGTNTTTEAIVVNVTNVNDNSPVLSVATPYSVAEGQTAVGTVTTTDADAGTTFTYSLTGTDADDFTITKTGEAQNGVITFDAAPDFETKTAYSLNVLVSDGTTTTTEAIVVNVTNINDNNPVFTSSASESINEGQTSVSTVEAGDADGNTIAYSIDSTGREDHALFTINSSTGALTMTARDFENPTDDHGTDDDNVYGVTVKATDNGTPARTATHDISVTVVNVNDNSPALTVNTPYSVAEGTTAVGTVTTTDGDAGTTTLTYSLTGTDKDDFTITKTGEAQNGVIAFSSAPDFETKTAYSLNVVVSDGTNTTTEAIVVNVTNVNDNSPALTVNTPYSVAEGQTAVGTVTTTDGDAGTTTLTYSLSGTDADDFTITKTGEAQNGVITFDAAPDFETKTAYSLNVVVSDGTNTTTEAIVVNVTNVNEAPVITTTSFTNIPEEQATIGNLAVTDDASDSISYAITGGADRLKFSVSGAALSFSANPNFEIPGDADGNNVYVVEITATDGGGLTDIETVSVTVVNANDAPVITTTTFTNISEEQTAVGTLAATDADSGDSITFAISGGADRLKFSAGGIGGSTLAFNGFTPDFDSPGSADSSNTYEVQITATDNGTGALTDVQTITVVITDLNDNSPALTVNTPYSVAEGTTAVGTVTTTDADAGTTLTYSLTGTDKDDFTITKTGAAQNGVIAFSSAPDFETKTAYSLNVVVSDGTNTTTEAIVVNVTNVNDNSPVLSVATPYSVAEGQTAVGTVTTTDADAGTTTLTYSLTGTDADDFTITKTGEAQNGVIAFSSAPDFETKTAYSLNVLVSDGTTTTTEAIVVNVTNINDNNPVFTSSTSESINEGQTSVSTVEAGDADGNTIAYSIDSTGREDHALFTINSSTGALTMTARDFENPTDDHGTDDNNVYGVTVKATDNGTPARTATHDISVTVVNVNEKPVITSSATFNQDENKAISNAAADVTPTDPDGAGSFTHSIVGGADETKFTINSVTGQIFFKSLRNFEIPGSTANSNAYVIDVQVTDTTTAANGVLSSDVQTVTITVNNINDAPVFTSSTSESINEGQTSVSTVEAGDADGNTIAYSIDSTGREDHALFTINSSTGALTMTARDFENPTDDHGTDDDNVYGVTVKATDNGTGALTATHDISVTVVNVNDNSPALTVNTPYSVAEGQTAVGTVTTTDGDAGTTTFTYSLSGTDADDFTITKTGEAQNGVITFDAAPDFETKTAYSLNVLVSDGTTTTTEAIVVNVTNINDNNPVFTSSASESINEGQTSVSTVEAGDADGNTIAYSIDSTGREDHALFTINSSTGALTMTARDFENPTDDHGTDDDNVYGVTVKATDNGTPARTATHDISVTVVNVNDNSPALTVNTPYSVAEGTTAVGTVTTTDGDAGTTTLTYSLTGTDKDDFTITKTGEAQNGVIAFSSAPDFETKTAYSLNVVVSDGTNTTTEAIVVNVTNVNDNSPVLSVATPYSVAEGQTAVGTVTTTDGDAGTTTFTYSLSGTDADDFTITKTGEAQNGVITFDAAPDFETKTAYSLNVLVSDGTTTTTEAIVVNVTNINDNNPVFTSSTSESINEGQTSVSTVEAGDADGNTIAYSIDSTGREDHALFTINSSTGALTMTARDFENPTDDHGTDDDNVYGVTVKATDNGTPARTATHDISVTVVNVNDNSPALTVNTPYSVAEGTTAVGTVTTTDGDAGTTTLTYSLTGTDKDDFTITKTGEAQNGVIAFSSAPDFETKTAYSLNVVVSDGTNTTTEAIVVNVTNVNDNSPVLSVATPYSVAEGQTAVGTVTTTDADAGTTTLTYSLSGTDADDFTITKTGEAQNGVITFDAAPDFETKTAYSLNVLVSDGTTTTTEAIVVNITNVNEAPVIGSSSTFSQPENTIEEFTVAATDVDASSSIVYSISGGTDGARFQINTSTGVLQFSGFIPNFEAPLFSVDNDYEVEVTASDGSLTTSQTITFTVTDVNEAPALTVNTPYSVAEGTTAVGTVTTTDVDAGTTTFTYSLSGTDADDFTITKTGAAQNGVIAFSSAPDFETKTAYSLNVLVSDGTNTTTKAIVVNVTNVNDNSPVLSVATPYSVAEGTTAVGTVTTTDGDAGTTTFTYSLSGTDADDFTITKTGEAQNGVITFDAAPDFETKTAYSLNVLVSDGTTTTTEAIVVNVTNVNDNSPVLTVNTPYSVAEGTTAVGTVTTTDADAGTTTLTYSLTGTDAGDFTITKTGVAQNGVIAFSSAPDFETKTAYSLNVLVSDGTTTTTEAIVVNVTNVNEAPVLTVNTPYSVAEGTTAVGTVTTTDADAGTTLTYSLSGTDADDFTITKTGEAQNGVITFDAAPDFETKTAYSLNVLVSDGTTTTTEAIVVNITNVNDNSPVLSVATPYSVAEGQTAVGTVTTTDGDAGTTTFTYSLSGTDADDFTITKTGEAQNGVITFDAAPDFETKTAYSLNVLVSDGTNTTTEAIVVNVTNINDNNPVFTSSTSESINEGQTSVSTVEAGDADGNTIAYSIDSTGREDHALFTINSSTGALTMTARDFENPTDDHGTDDDNVYGVTVKATDNGTPARTATHDISVTVVNVNDNSPALTVNTPYSVAEGTTAVGTVTTTDGDAGTTTLTYSLTGTDKDDFTITKTGEAQNGVIAFSSAPDFETKTAYSLNVVVSDGTNTTTEAIVVNVTNVNEAPVITTTSFGSIAENQTAIGSLAVTDDAGDSITFTITGGDDQGKFTVSGST